MFPSSTRATIEAASYISSPRKQRRVQFRSQEASNVAGAQRQRVRPVLLGLVDVH